MTLPTQSITDSTNRFHEPIPVEPFLAWAETRIEHIRRDLDSLPAVQRLSTLGEEQRFLADIGWDSDAGTRRLHRWRHELLTGNAERAIIEDALAHAGIGMWEIYPHLQDEPAPRPPAGRAVRKMTDRQVIAAHTVYLRGRLTLPILGHKIYDVYGYANPASATKALTDAFHAFGLPTRQCASVTRAGQPCNASPTAGVDHCPAHDTSREAPWISALAKAHAAAPPARRVLPEHLLLRARDMHQAEGAAISRIAQQMAPTVGLSSSWLAALLYAEFDAHGWERSGRQLPRLSRVA